jgi:enoyl-CoA hydratase/carnithine racemase
VTDACAPDPALIADLVTLGGAGLSVTELDEGPPEPPTGPGVVRVGVHRRGPRPPALAAYDILLSADPSAPRPWVGMAPDRLDAALAALAAAVSRAPVAAAVAAQVLRTSLLVSFDEALVQESIAYSMLLGSAEFRAWRAANPARARLADAAARVRTYEAGGVLHVRLDRPQRRNAFDAAMRDALCEALGFALDHPDAPPVVLSGEGPAVSAGGDLDEFGAAPDPGLAHLVRTLRAPVRLVHALGDRANAHLHGACIGAGIEVPAAAAHVTARPGTVFRLPEVAMGLIPGAGGTATIPRRIGRRRAAWMAISGAEVDLSTALAWGLVDEIAA